MVMLEQLFYQLIQERRYLFFIFIMFYILFRDLFIFQKFLFLYLQDESDDEELEEEYDYEDFEEFDNEMIELEVE